ncbi:MAG: ankyrin repeat domain-containing protein [Legionellaceae bacterium]
MRKAALITLLSIRKNVRTTILLALMDYFDNEQDILFQDLVNILNLNGVELVFPPKGTLQRYSDNVLFYCFITGKSLQESSQRTLHTFPNDILCNIFQFLDAKNAATISRCSRYFYHQTKSDVYWQNNLVNLGCNRKELTKIIHKKVIQNYRSLYRTIQHLAYADRAKLTSREFCYLIGEILALKNATREALMARRGRNVLHCTALSASVEAMKYAVDVLGVARDSRDHHGSNALHYAAHTGSVEAMKYALDVLGLSQDSCDHHGRNALHYAAHSGSLEANYFLYQSSHEHNLTWNPTLQDGHGHDAFLYANNARCTPEVKRMIIRFMLYPHALAKNRPTECLMI